MRSLKEAFRENASRTLRAWVFSTSLRLRWVTPEMFVRAVEGESFSKQLVYKAFYALEEAKLLRRRDLGRQKIFIPTGKAYNLALHHGLGLMPSRKSRTYLGNFEHAYLLRASAIYNEYNLSDQGAIAVLGHIWAKERGVKSPVPDYALILVVSDGENYFYYANLLVQVETGTRNPKSIRKRFGEELELLREAPEANFLYVFYPEKLKPSYVRLFEEVSKSVDEEILERHSLSPSFQVGFAEAEDPKRTFRKSLSRAHYAFILREEPLLPPITYLIRKRR